MLVFTTTFPVSEKLSLEEFIDLAIEWVSNPKSRYDLKNIVWDKSTTFIVSDKSKNVEFTINMIKESNTVAVRLKNLDENIEWISDFILTNNNVSIQLQRNSTDNADYIPKFHIPYILKMIFDKNYGGCDNNLIVNNKPLFITKENINIIIDIINGGSIYKLPIVYISKKIYGDYIIDIEQISRYLAGIAHILVEENTNISKILQKETNDCNPYNGAIQIYYPKNFTKRFVPNTYSSQIEIQRNIINFINERNLQMKIEDKFQYYYVVQNILKSKRLEAEKKHKQTSDDIDSLTEMYDTLDEQYCALKEEKKQLQSELNDAKAKIIGLQDKIESLIERMDELNDTQNVPLLYFGKERDLYEGEQLDILLDVLTEALNKNIKNTTPTPRRRHIVESILERNKPTGVLRNKIKTVEEIFKSPRINAQDKTKLEKIGIFITSENSHYKIKLENDSRYYTTVAKTTSDKGRSNKNVVSNIKNSFF